MDNQKFYNDLLEEEARLLGEIKILNELLEPIQVLRLRYSQANGFSNGTTINHIEHEKEPNTGRRNYKPRVGNVANRVFESLKLIDIGSANDVGNVLFSNHPNEFSLEQARIAAKSALSKMNKEGIITGIKMDGKNSFMYSINHDDVPLDFPTEPQEDDSLDLDWLYDSQQPEEEKQTPPDDDDLPF